MNIRIIMMMISDFLEISDVIICYNYNDYMLCNLRLTINKKKTRFGTPFRLKRGVF